MNQSSPFSKLRINEREYVCNLFNQSFVELQHVLTAVISFEWTVVSLSSGYSIFHTVVYKSGTHFLRRSFIFRVIFKGKNGKLMVKYVHGKELH